MNLLHVRQGKSPIPSLSFDSQQSMKIQIQINIKKNTDLLHNLQNVSSVLLHKNLNCFNAYNTKS